MTNDREADAETIARLRSYLRSKGVHVLNGRPKPLLAIIAAGETLLLAIAALVAALLGADAETIALVEGLVGAVGAFALTLVGMSKVTPISAPRVPKGTDVEFYRAA